MMTSKEKKVIDDINDKLDRIESHLAWLITPGQRFRVGQRVEFSRRASRHGIVTKREARVRGTVLGIDGFSIRVAIDHRKQPKTLHHAFLNPVQGAKMF